MLATLADYFARDGWAVEAGPVPSTLALRYGGESGTWECIAQARDDHRQFVFYSLFPEPVAETQRRSMAELITRINSGLVIGNFELDLERGHLRMKTSLDVGDQDLMAGLIEPAVRANLVAMDHYLPALFVVQQGSMDVKQALAFADG